MFERFKDRPVKEVLGPPMIVVGLALCVWATLERGLFDGLIVFGGLCGAASAWTIFFPSRPRLTVEVRSPEEPNVLTVSFPEPVRPLDKDAIVSEQAEAALATMPERPDPDIREDDPWQEVANKVLATGLRSALTGVSGAAIDEFEEQVNSYRRRLRAWLGQVERARWDRLRIFEGKLSIRECGHAAADHVHLRLRFPEGFELDEGLFRADSPPRRPTYAPVLPAWPGVQSTIGAWEGLAVRDVRPIHLPRSERARYSLDSGLSVIDYDLGRVNQSDHRDVSAFSLRAPGPGSYEIEWEASAAALEKPAKGTFVIKVAEPIAADPITSMAEAEAESKK